MIKKHLMASGLPSLAALNIGGRVDSGLTAAGTTQADATISPGDIVWFTTVATGTGFRLRADAEPGDEIKVYNGGANALLVYPQVGGTINALATNASFSLAAGKMAIFTNGTGLAWAGNLSA